MVVKAKVVADELLLASPRTRTDLWAGCLIRPQNLEKESKQKERLVLELNSNNWYNRWGPNHQALNFFP